MNPLFSDAFYKIGIRHCTASRQKGDCLEIFCVDVIKTLCVGRIQPSMWYETEANKRMTSGEPEPRYLHNLDTLRKAKQEHKD